MQRVAREKELTPRSRLALFHHTAVNAETACTLEDSEISFDLMMRSGVKASNLIVAGIGALGLKARGVHSATQLRQLGFDALHLCDADFCNETSMAFGAEATVDAFLVSAADAVSLSGTEALHILQISTRRLLECCAGFPGEALAVLQQLPQGASLRGVPCSVLLDAGLRANTLAKTGYGLAGICDQVAPTGTELARLGYSF